MTTTAAGSRPSTRQMLNKVPEVTIWFWIIKILCTTVGESFADWINMTLGVGLDATALIFTAVLAVVWAAQFRTDRYVPFVYWLSVVVVSVTGTLYTDILTDDRGVPLKVSTTVFSVLLALVFGVWYARERTLSIHSIVTLPREAFYWLAVLVTFALGTAAGDWTLELTGWGPGRSVLLPAGLIAIIAIGWRAGAQPVLAFWLAYILTRPLGANIGDWLASPKADKGLGVGTAGTSVIFLGAIAATVAYLTVSKADVIPSDRAVDRRPAVGSPYRQNTVLAAFALVAVATGALLHHTSTQPHANALDEEEGNSSAAAAAGIQMAPGQAAAKYPAADVATFRTIVSDSLARVTADDQAGAVTRIKDLETAWDDAQARLQALDPTGWDYIDAKNDAVFSALRAKTPDAAAEKAALGDLLTALAPMSAKTGAAVAAQGATQPAASAAPGAGQAHPAQAGQAMAAFPAADVTNFRTITKDTLGLLTAGKQAAATKRITDLESAWDEAQSRLKPLDSAGWTAIDGRIDAVLSALRAKNPTTATEKHALTVLLSALG